MPGSASAVTSGGFPVGPLLNPAGSGRAGEVLTSPRPPRGWRVSRSAWAAAWALRTAYSRALPRIVERPVDPPRALPCRTVSFSCERDLPEQVASLRSVLRFGGRPHEAIVVSDGTHTRRSRALLERVDPCVRVVHWQDYVADDLPRAVRGYAASSPMGKKLAVELSLPTDRVLVYVDADVLLLPAARPALPQALTRDVPGYLLDPEDVYLDRRLLRSGEQEEPLNAGFLVLPGPLDWDEPLARFERLVDEPSFHTEQTLVHLAVRAAGGRPLDPGRWVVSTDDMPLWGDRHRGADTVLRHYTSPVRHKLWLSLSRQRRPCSRCA